MMDSDGDGRTNGEELGDPTCEWQQKNHTPLSKTVSHPGVCEPIGSPVCAQKPNSYVCPGQRNLDCPSFARNDTEKLHINMTNAHVPIKASSYVCLEVRLPFDQDYHLLAAEPIIDQSKIVDQIQIFACDSGLHSRVYNHPFECGEKPRGDCQSLIGGYSRHENGICFPPKSGYRIGENGCRQMIFQIRYKNPYLNPALYDSSGITLYYTSYLQRYELGNKLISVTHFTLPTGQKTTTITSEYPGECSTMQMSKPIYITGAFIHMHSYGRQQIVELIRDGVPVEVIADGTGFKAHNLKGTHLKKPIRMFPGDSIRTVCWYDTTTAKTPIKWGLLSTNEMCSTSLMYYPRDDWLDATATSFKQIPLCKLQTTGEANGCHFGRLFDAVRQPDATSVALDHCATEKICTNACASIASVAFTHPCLRGDNYELLQSRLTRKFERLKNFMDALKLCRVEYINNTNDQETITTTTEIPPTVHSNIDLSNFQIPTGGKTQYNNPGIPIPFQKTRQSTSRMGSMQNRRVRPVRTNSQVRKNSIHPQHVIEAMELKQQSEKRLTLAHIQSVPSRRNSVRATPFPTPVFPKQINTRGTRTFSPQGEQNVPSLEPRENPLVAKLANFIHTMHNPSNA
ncbi:dopamine beta-monooxygenase [Mytilus galloprovincialis]|uniref:Dopamine beta-monooxygenase n=1 Tax=Mytilus galloprovincialis TaxID=29158 RepID=A0A8B6GBF1_MYTGA|nr:dopamine beta-monooxygenase [Mytilus galloprovincialis]